MHSEQQVRMLYDLLYIQLLSVLAEQPATVTELAQETEIGFDATLYRVRAMVAAGLVRVVAQRPRAGRAIQVYRAVAYKYFIPDELLRNMVFKGWQEHQGAWNILNEVLGQLVPNDVRAGQAITGEAVLFASSGTVNRTRSAYTKAGVEEVIIPRNTDRLLTYGILELTPQIATELAITLREAFQAAAKKSAATPELQNQYSIVVGLSPKPN